MTGALVDTTCPFCGKTHDTTSETGGRVDYPEDGDPTLCDHCGQFCIYDREADGGLRKPTKREQRELSHYDLAQQALTAWKTARRQ